MSILQEIAGRQWILGLILLGIALALPRHGARLLSALLRVATALGHRPLAALLLGGLLGGGGTALVATVGRFPEPRVHDEFSYLLAADTFAHGKLTNPTHPQWEHFESFHIIHEPTYQSKFHPGQGLTLAIGQRFAGHPIVGVWLQAFLFGVALTWMLRAWLPPRWGVLGAGIGILHFGITTYWTQSYWGGTLAAVGGALVYGALPRVRERARARDACLLGTGVGLLAITRPYEGAVATLPAALVLAHWGWRSMRAGRSHEMLRTLFLVAAPLTLTLIGLGLYHTAVTGSPWVFPYTIHDNRYATLTPFLFIEPFEVEPYRHEVIRAFWADWAFGHWKAQQTLEGFLRAVRHRGEVMWSYFLGPYLSLPLLALPWALRRRGSRLSLGALAAMTVALLIMTYRQAHYAAPITALLVLLIVQCSRQLVLLRPGGRPVGQSVLTACLVMLVAYHSGQALRDAVEPDRWCERRAAMLRRLESESQRQLVIVEYGPDHDFLDEWVYNEADIDGARVVWARDMGREENRDLIEHFAGREVWRLRLGFAGESEGLEPYSP